ncbi:hypothetical protein [Leptospira levettii]|uniref:hypothetical protein n=1 Tax=Leptospira levettii TaxID=2023178 RepID=UPI003EBD1F3F
MNKKSVTDFRKYIEKEIEPALEDLKRLDEKNRIHIQKLVYTNLVDRFDTMIDYTIINNCREQGFIDIALKDLTGNITESDLIKILLQGEKIQGALDIKLQNSLRNSILRQRHSMKITTLFSIFHPEINVSGAQRVNVPTGEIFESVKPQKSVQIPYSISGYADWLYSRRNSIVHGGGNNKFLENDRIQIKKMYKKEPPETFKIKLSSVTNALTFYNDLTKILIS